MRFVRKYNIVDIDGESYFLGANTKNGFSGIQEDIFSEDLLDRLYIIKGAPGCGKSRLMQSVANEAERRGHKVIRYLCGSDHTSLDGIVIDGKCAVCDGTAPHTMDMKYPGAISETVDMSVFWNDALLTDKLSDIRMLSRKKSEAYIRGYRYLKGAEQVSVEQEYDVLSCCMLEKITKAADRISSSLKKDGSPCRNSVFTRSIGMTGMNRLPTFEKMADRIISVNDIYGSSSVFMKILSDSLYRHGVSHTLSIDPVSGYTVNDIFIKDKGLLITAESTDRAEKQINMTRFIDTSALGCVRGALRLTEKCENELIGEAVASFRKASEAHFALEKIYGQSMDYNSLNKYTAQLTDRILTSLRKNI